MLRLRSRPRQRSAFLRHRVPPSSGARVSQSDSDARKADRRIHAGAIGGNVAHQSNASSATARNSGFSSDSFVLYISGARSIVQTAPPAASQHCMRRGDVPFRSGSQPRIKIGAPFRENAQLQRTPDRRAIRPNRNRRDEFVDECFEPFAAVTATGNDDQLARAIHSARVDRARAVLIATFRAARGDIAGVRRRPARARPRYRASRDDLRSARC